ncbi:ABC transporter permease [Ancylobacter sp. A5.8]|uniref:ABC transporter permease n=1 Tax=Ancylobacter gelatini TaxID=2919920 RepID=UPI001F4DA8D5|nr:ABC transporter permease [Ancylobacter gelatini]MCJ8142620.1 ABC transporter permease [Ancylobacter gelatini]
MAAEKHDVPPAAVNANLTEREKLEIESSFRNEIVATRHRRLRRGLMFNLIGVLIFLAVWEVLPRIVPGVNIQMFPPPSGVIATLYGMLADGQLAAHAWSSLKRVAAGFVIGSSAGILVGLFTGRLALLQSMSDPVLHGLRSIPAIAFVPLAIVWFGLGETPKIALISWGTFFPVWISTFIGVRDVPKLYVQSALSLGAGPLNVMFRVVLPAAMPFVFAGLRHATAVAFVIVVAAELVGASSGLGYLISFSHLVFRIDMMFVGLLALGVLGFLADAAFAALLQRLFPWYRAERS